MRSRLLLIALVFAVAACAAPPDPLPGYTRASAEQHDSLMRAVSDYYTVRERAFVSGDATVLFAAYPRLAQGEDLREGVNLDAFWVPHMRDLGVVDLTDDLQGYEPPRLYVKGTAAVAFVHGWEIWTYPRGDITGLEFFTRIDLVNDADRWIVERTDEQMMGEPPPKTPRR